MSSFTYFASTVARKFIVGLTGLLLVAFIVVHLGGNLTMLVGRDLFNSYTHHLESLGPLLYLAEVGLLLLFACHAVLAIRVQLEKRTARPSGYAVTANSEERRSRGRPLPWNWYSEANALFPPTSRNIPLSRV